MQEEWSIASIKKEDRDKYLERYLYFFPLYGINGFFKIKNTNNNNDNTDSDNEEKIVNEYVPDSKDSNESITSNTLKQWSITQYILSLFGIKNNKIHNNINDNNLTENRTNIPDQLIKALKNLKNVMMNLKN